MTVAAFKRGGLRVGATVSHQGIGEGDGSSYLLDNWLVGHSEQRSVGLDTSLTLAHCIDRRGNQRQRPVRVAVEVSVGDDAGRVRIASVVVDAGAYLEQLGRRRCGLEALDRESGRH